MVLYKAETPNIVATDGAITTTGSNRLAVTVSPAATSQFAVTTSAGSPQTAGGSFDLTVVAKDQFNNVDTNYGGTVAFTSSDGSAVLPGAYHFLPADLGAQTFSGGVTLKTSGSRSVTATDNVTGSINGNTSVNVGAAAATHLTVTTTAATPRITWSRSATARSCDHPSRKRSIS